MLENNSTSCASICKECVKNRTLIKKYEKLTHLYEKKQLKLSTNGSSCISNGKTTNYTFDSPTGDIPCLRLVQVLNQLVKKQYKCFFRQPFQKSAKKLVLLSMFNRINKYVKTNAFKNIHEYSKKQINSIQEEFDAEIKQTSKQGFTNIKNNNEISVTQCLITENIAKPQQWARKFINDLQELKKQSTCSNNQRYIQRRNMELEIINKKLTMQNKILRDCIVEVDKKQAKENQKKRETLEQLAQQMSQKNEQLQQLRQALKAYQQKDQYEKVLEHDVLSIKKQVDHLQKFNDRLNVDLQKVKNQLFQTSSKLKQSEQKYAKLERQLQQTNKINFMLNCKAEKTQQSQKQYQKLIKLIQKKLKRLNLYEKQLQQSIGNQNAKFLSQPVNTVQQLKSEMILMFLANINNQDYKLCAQNLFDQEEKNLLIQHRKAWKDNEKQTILAKSEHQQNNQLHRIDCLEISEIQNNGNHMDSILNVWQCTRQNVHQVQQSQTKESATMRILELQIQSKKQVGKITELKEKLLHIRVIVLKLLKSLDLQADIKQQAKDILRILIDIFEYSEEERENLFTKKKRMFGFI